MFLSAGRATPGGVLRVRGGWHHGSNKAVGWLPRPHYLDSPLLSRTLAHCSGAKVMNGKTPLHAVVIQTTAEAQLDVAHPQARTFLQNFNAISG